MSLDTIAQDNVGHFTTAAAGPLTISEVVVPIAPAATSASIFVPTDLVTAAPSLGATPGTVSVDMEIIVGTGLAMMAIAG